MVARKQGLEASIWADQWSRHPTTTTYYHHHPHQHHHRRPEPRPRSVPPEETHTAYTSRPAAAAPAPPPHLTPGASTSLAPVQAFQRFEQACHRLRWKFVDLQNSYNRAMSPADAGFTPADAERNFKIDFYEFYAWIEQAIVLVLHVFGVAVSRRPLPPSTTSNGGGGGGSHAFHHNVLTALEDLDAEPLREALARGETNQALWKAKELRNRWKDAAEGRETPPLKMYDLRWIVGRVLGGLEEAYAVAARKVEEEVRQRRDLGTSAAAAAAVAEEKQEEEDSWEWMVDSMDWEA